MKNHQIARFHPQGWRLATGRVGVTVERAAVRVRHIASREVRFQHPVPAAQIFRFRNYAPNSRPRTNRLAPLSSLFWSCLFWPGLHRFVLCWLYLCGLGLGKRAPRRNEEDKNRYPSRFGHGITVIDWRRAFARQCGESNFPSLPKADEPHVNTASPRCTAASSSSHHSSCRESIAPGDTSRLNAFLLSSS
jgi:hypothetical protein